MSWASAAVIHPLVTSVAVKLPTMEAGTMRPAGGEQARGTL